MLKIHWHRTFCYCIIIGNMTLRKDKVWCTLTLCQSRYQSVSIYISIFMHTCILYKIQHNNYNIIFNSILCQFITINIQSSLLLFLFHFVVDVALFFFSIRSCVFCWGANSFEGYCFFSTSCTEVYHMLDPAHWTESDTLSWHYNQPSPLAYTFILDKTLSFKQKM